MIFGVPIRVSDVALVYAFEVRRVPGKKKRKRYRVARTYKPGAYSLADGSIVMHPTVYAKFRVATERI